MTIRETIRTQIRSMKDRSWREKISYFLEYYGGKTLLLLLGLGIIVAFCVTLAAQKTPAFTATFFGAEPQPAAEDFLSGYIQAAGIDDQRNEVSILTYDDIQADAVISQDTYQSIEVFTAMAASHSVDCFAANTDFFLVYAYRDYAIDLRTVLRPSELDALAPYLRYIDGALRDAEDANDAGATQKPVWPDAACPERMDDPIPVGIVLSKATGAFAESYPFACDDPVIGVCANSDHVDNAAVFLWYCFGFFE